MGYGANAPGMKPPIEFKVRGKAGINLHEVIYRFDSKSMPGALNEEVRLGGEARKGTYFHVKIHVSIVWWVGLRGVWLLMSMMFVSGRDISRRRLLSRFRPTIR